MKIGVFWEGVLYAGHGAASDPLFDGPLVPGAIAWLSELSISKDVDAIIICSAWLRILCPYNPTQFENAMRRCLTDGGLPKEVYYRLQLWADEGIPAVDMLISVNGYRFTGAYPSLRGIAEAKPWGDSLQAKMWIG